MKFVIAFLIALVAAVALMFWLTRPDPKWDSPVPAQPWEWSDKSCPPDIACSKGQILLPGKGE